MLKQCPSHGEKLTMFCSKNSSMLCMKCFSEASLETRLHCVDIDIAYEQRKKSLDLAISVRKVRSRLSTVRLKKRGNLLLTLVFFSIIERTVIYNRAPLTLLLPFNKFVIEVLCTSLVSLPFLCSLCKKSNRR